MTPEERAEDFVAGVIGVNIIIGRITFEYQLDGKYKIKYNSPGKPYKGLKSGKIVNKSTIDKFREFRENSNIKSKVNSITNKISKSNKNNYKKISGSNNFFFLEHLSKSKRLCTNSNAGVRSLTYLINLRQISSIKKGNKFELEMVKILIENMIAATINTSKKDTTELEETFNKKRGHFQIKMQDDHDKQKSDAIISTEKLKQPHYDISGLMFAEPTIKYRKKYEEAGLVCLYGTDEIAKYYGLGPKVFEPFWKEVYEINGYYSSLTDEDIYRHIEKELLLNPDPKKKLIQKCKKVLEYHQDSLEIAPKLLKLLSRYETSF